MASPPNSPKPMESDSQSATRYQYETPWNMYSMAWHPQAPIRLAAGSYLETEANKLQILEVNKDTNRLRCVAETDTTFPSTKTMWGPAQITQESPNGNKESSDLVATTSTTLNLWQYKDGELKSYAKLANARTKAPGGHSPPLTSFDWTAFNYHKIGTSSVDSTCTIWNVERQKIETQLIAHDKAVHDICFSHTKESLFASVGADGSVRLFDQRNLDHSTIIYEDASPLLRLAWSGRNTYHIATVAADVPGVILIDIRRPSAALAALREHNCMINNICWAPHNEKYLLCGTDDGCGLIWDVGSGISGKSQSEPSKVWWHDCNHEVYQVQWPQGHPDYVALGTTKGIDIVQI